MSKPDTERCELWSLDPPRKIGDGELFLGGHGLPMVRQFDRLPGTQYDLWSFPANWQLKPCQGQSAGMLLEKWWQVEEIMAELAVWKKRHELAGRVERRNEEFGGIIDD